ncbi:hypothetical protein TUBRATIS_16400 [Tubulinosema ratisbonensis]|uniref:Uncharacterized protein n=1 Tax=Tubulinosema ratisbonensis TaxID=291195 RepID=A0A437ALL7_9MICR|nr:hypothetical protein TUBRATIS_16400 [Tubulinosema ratisbonensis]
MVTITENDVNLQSTSGATNLEDPEQSPTLQTLDIKQIVDKLTRDERIKEKYSDIDENGSMTWLLLKLLHCPFTKRIFHKILIFYNLNRKLFRLILFSIYICCSFILFMALFGYYRQIYLFDILFIGSLSNICNVIQLIMNYFYKSKYDCWLESSFLICYLLIIEVMLAVRFYYEEIFFDRISFFFIFLCTFLVFIYNFLMSLKYFNT